MNRSFDESIQLLVDDELSATETDELLLRCEAEPEGWRRLALTFLEERALTNAAASWGKEATTNLTDRKVDQPEPTTDRWTLPINEKQGPSWNTMIGMIASIAALIAIAVVWRFPEKISNDTNRAPRDTTESVAAASSPSSVQESLDTSQDGTLSQQATGTSGDGLAAHSRLWSEGQVTTRLSPRTRLEWLQRGLWIDEAPEFQIVEHEGQRYTVPKSKINVTYVGDWIYQ